MKKAKNIFDELYHNKFAPLYDFFQHGVKNDIKGRVKIDYRNRYDMAEQMMHQEFRFTYSGGQEEIIPLKMRFFFRFEIEHLLRLAGFKIKNLYGDFNKNSFKSDSSEMLWVAKPV
ncbi:hypothetical protein COT64_00025 [Candidatus Shapirobacteria bacterium CG09_land_8_20_14_0_10_39_12]|uniref:Uncharacterized protein n=1 Tax=Candidatus Shapirobacteria bacterium CG09_land_8_20_14_0_10_39_12 TaxID=1974885 RepID=A0A2H0WQJ2_9BACT|nr:MAG: hypothetical protein COT64_00025 [Candidatus Shapirobacteria bacterium CG09_land_8_20_14_0_10_39_12]